MESAALRFMLMAVAGWWSDQRQAAVVYLIEENRILRAQLSGRRLRLTDDDRCRLARCGQRLGRRLLRQVATIVTPDTILRWHRQLIARTWTHAKGRSSRRGVLTEIRQLVGRMAEENPTWGLHTDPRRTEERRASGRTIDDRPDPEGPGDFSRAGSADLVADVPASALGSDRWGRFLHD